MSWGGNIFVKLCALEHETKFCSDFFSSFLPQDIWPLLHRNYQVVKSDDDETFKRVWGFVKSQLKDFSLPEPDGICVSRI